MNKIETLENKQRETLEAVSKDDLVAWLAHPVTKLLLMQIDIDKEEIKDTWSSGGYDTRERELIARGSVEALESIRTVMVGLVDD